MIKGWWPFVSRAAGPRFGLRPRFTALFLVMALIVAATGTFGIRKIMEVGGYVQMMMKTRATQQKMAVLMKMTVQESWRHLVEVATAASGADEFDEASYDYEAAAGRFRGYVQLLMKGNAKVGLAPVSPGANSRHCCRRWSATGLAFETAADAVRALKLAQSTAARRAPDAACARRTPS